MTSHIRWSWTLLPAAALIVAFTPDLVARSQGAGTKSIFVSVLDDAGKPVTGLTAADFAVREDNSPREITSVKPATQPLFIALLGDTTRNAGATGMSGRSSAGSELIRDIRNSFAGFAKRIAAASPESQLSVMEFGQAAITITNFTNALPEVEKGIGRLFPKPGAASVLLEALVEANKQIEKKNSPRKALVVVNIEPGDEQSRQEPNKIIEAFRNSGASLWAASLQNGELRNPARDLVLNRLTQITGGRREFILSPAALENWLNVFAAALTNQYEVSYTRPASDKPTQIVGVGITREGAKPYASYFPPK